MASPPPELAAAGALVDDYSTFHHNNRSPALLSDDVAGFVSTAASATRLSLKATHALTDLVFDAAKYTTSASLGVSRRALVHAVSTALHLHALGTTRGQTRRDVSDAFVRALEKYTMYSIKLIHHTFSLAELFALAGVQLTSRFVASGLAAAEGSVRMVDGIFGRTETSRALAAVVHLVRKEIYEDEDFQPLASMGKLSVLARIAKALTAYACLQNATHARSMNRVRMTLLYRAEVALGDCGYERAKPAASSPKDFCCGEEKSGTCPNCACQSLCALGCPAEPTTSEYTDPRIAVPGIGTTSDNQGTGSHTVTTAVVAMPERVSPESTSPGDPSSSGLPAVTAAPSTSCPHHHDYHYHRHHRLNGDPCLHSHDAPHLSSLSHPCQVLHTPASAVDLERETVEREFEFRVSAIHSRAEGPGPADFHFNVDENGNLCAKSHPVNLEGRSLHCSTNDARRSNVCPATCPRSLPNRERDTPSHSPLQCKKPSAHAPAKPFRRHRMNGGATASVASKSSTNKQFPSSQGSPRRITTLPSSQLPLKASKYLSLLFDSMNRQVVSGSPKKLRITVTEVKPTKTAKHATQMEREAERGTTLRISQSRSAKPNSTGDSSSLPHEDRPAQRSPGSIVESTHINQAQRETRPEPFSSLAPYDPVLSNGRNPLQNALPRMDRRHNGEFVPRYPHFPHLPFLQNLWRFLRYSTAAYGPALMSLVGVGQVEDLLHLPSGNCSPHFSGCGAFGHHPNHHALARHTKLPVASILLSSFSSPGCADEAENPGRSDVGDTSSRSSGSSNGSGSTNKAPPNPATTPLLSPPKMHTLVHYVVVDHMAKAIVLTCRGTLGLSDILTDVTCQYEELNIQGEKYRVHAGFLRSARMLGRPGGEALRTLRRALEEYEGYGLILTGHSLGGAVAAILAMLWSEPLSGVQEEGLDAEAGSTETDGGESGVPSLRGADCRRPSVPAMRDQQASHRRFVTSRESGLPPGRPVHCYGYGVPALTDVMLSRACLGLVTTIVHNTDIVPSLSLGLVRDFKNVAVSLWWEGVVNPNGSPVSAEGIIRRALGVRRNRTASAASKPLPAEGKNPECTHGAAAAASRTLGADGNPDEDEAWLWALMKTLRANMAAEKLVPPGAVYIVSSHLAPVDVPPSALSPSRSSTSPCSGSDLCHASLAASAMADCGAPPSAGQSLASSLLQRSIGLHRASQPAQVRRATLHRVQDVATRFSEIHFSRTMFSDHSPKGYEEAVGCLVDGWKPTEEP